TEPGDERFVLTTADASQAAPAAYTNTGPALDAVADVTTAPGARSAARTLARAASALEDATHLNKEIYLISDLQRRTWTDSLAAGRPADGRALLLPVGGRTFANIAVRGAAAEGRSLGVGQPARVEAALANYGNERIEGYVASV